MFVFDLLGFMLLADCLVFVVDCCWLSLGCLGVGGLGLFGGCCFLLLVYSYVGWFV